MSTEKTELDEELAAIRQAAEESGAQLCPGLLWIGEGEPGFKVMLEATELTRLLRHMRPRSLYLWIDQFDAQIDALNRLDLADDDDDDDEMERAALVNPKMKAILTRWRKRDGETASYVASFVADGVLHTTVNSADWKHEFEDDLESWSNENAQRVANAKRTVRTLEHEDIVAKARKLVEDSRFSAPSVSRAKRARLAAHLFPELTQEKLEKIVEEAIMLEYLAKGGGRAAV